MTAQIVRFGVLDMQICIPADWSDQQAKEFADDMNTCGTRNGWIIRKEGSKWLAGDPERCACEERAGFVHLTLDA